MIRLLAFVPFVLVSLSSSFAQAPDGRPEVAQRIRQLEESASKKGKEDVKALEHVGWLAHEFEASGTKDKAAIVKAVSAAVKEPRPRPDKKSYNDRLARAGASALGGFGESATSALADLLDERELRKNPDLLEILLEALGRTRGKKAMPILVDYVTRRDVSAIRGAARGIEHFADADGATRKKGFEAAFKTLVFVFDELSNEPDGGAGMKEYWQEVSTPLAHALAKLSAHEEKDVNGWQRWWNDHKNASWDKAR